MRFLHFICFACLQYIACNQVTDSRKFRSPEEIVNPNGDSELAIVMRHLHFEADKVGRTIEAGEEVKLEELRALAGRLDSSEPTDSSSLGGDYFALSGQFRAAVERLQGENKIVEFNALVGTCISCHRTTCPGPIRKIGKLMIKA
jgi:hypothetical protein